MCQCIYWLVSAQGGSLSQLLLHWRHFIWILQLTIALFVSQNSNKSPVVLTHLEPVTILCAHILKTLWKVVETVAGSGKAVAPQVSCEEQDNEYICKKHISALTLLLIRLCICKAVSIVCDGALKWFLYTSLSKASPTTAVLTLSLFDHLYFCQEIYLHLSLYISVYTSVYFSFSLHWAQNGIN